MTGLLGGLPQLVTPTWLVGSAEMVQVGLLECYITSSRTFSTEDPFGQWHSCVPLASASPRLQALYKVKHFLAGQLGQPLDITFYSTLCSFIRKTGGSLEVLAHALRLRSKVRKRLHSFPLEAHYSVVTSHLVETVSSGPPCFKVRTFRKHCQSLSS